MPIRLRPAEIRTPDDDPFKNDLLGSERPAEVLTGLVSSFDGPGVVAIDAPWGAGKTTFLRMWSRQLKKDGFTVVVFNAWDTDFAADPFLALSAELQERLQSSGADIPPEAMQEIREWSMELLRQGVPQFVRLAVDAVPFAGSLAGNMAESIMDRFTESRVSGYKKTKEAVCGFRKALESTAAAVFESSEKKPLIVIIDELDRCRPTYAVELLETAKHLFSVDHVVFVLAINRTELVHSIRALYGDNFDADKYLHRFIDADIRLPRSDRRALLKNAIESVQMRESPTTQADRDELDRAMGILETLFSMSSIDVRTVLQALHRLGIVLNSIPERSYAFVLAASVATVILAHDLESYQKLKQGTASDMDLIDAVRRNCPDREWNSEYMTAVFESAAIRLVVEQSSAETQESRTPVLREYQNILQELGVERSALSKDERIRRLRRICERVERWTPGGDKTASLRDEFKYVSERLDMVSWIAPS